MKKAKRVVYVMLCVLLTLATLAGCSGGGSTTPAPSAKPSGAATTAEKNPAAPPAGAKLAETITIAALPCSVIDPGNRAFYTPQVAWISYNVYNSLAKLTPDNKYEPSLATEWKTTDYKTFTFKLRNDVTFHNGEKFKADDVVFTLERGKASVGTQAFDRWNKIESYKVVNDYEIVLTLKAVNIDFIDEIASAGCSILNRKAVTADPKDGARIGTGPYKVDKLIVNQQIEFVRNDNYWGQKAYTKKLIFKNVAEQSAVLIMLDNNELDSAHGLNSIYLPDVEKNPKYDSIRFTVNNTAFIGFNMLDPLMADINFRMAVAHALNRGDMVLGTKNGYAEAPKSGTFWGYSSEFKNNDVPLIPLNIAKAKEYLAKTNYKGQEIEIVSAIDDHIKNAQIIQEQLKAVGINIKIYQTDIAGISAYTPVGGKKHQIIVYSSAWSNLASTIRTLAYPGMTGNRANYNNPKVTELLDKAATTLDAKQRETMYKEVQTIIGTEIPYMPIFNMIYTITNQKGVGGIKVYSSMNHDHSGIFRVIG
jgi:peptide/nickel transport system substrate-binding protein